MPDLTTADVQAMAAALELPLTPEDLVEAIRSRPGQSFPMTIERDGKTLTVNVTPEPVKEKTPDGQEREVGRIQAWPVR